MTTSSLHKDIAMSPQPPTLTKEIDIKDFYTLPLPGSNVEEE